MQTVVDHPEPDVASEAGLRSLLASSLQEEAGLLDTLRDIFVNQREALGLGDPRALDDGVFAATRVLRTMEEARLRRSRITKGLVGSEIGFDEIDTVLTGSLNRPVRIALEQVRRAAAGLREEVGLLRRILQVALSDNRNYLATLLGEEVESASSEGTYRHLGEGDNIGPGAPGVVFDRTI